MAKLWLGTAQFGIDYGISNVVGKVSRGDVATILRRAHALGIDTLDTAPAYGSSERVLGELDAPGRFRIVTKTPQFRVDAIGPEHGAAVRRSLDGSLAALKTDRAWGLLVHWPGDLLAPGGEHVYRALQHAKHDELVGHIGVSAYEPQEVIAILDRYDVDMVQIPLNLFDQRFVHAGILELCHARGVSVHSRSTFLQGLLLMTPETLPPRMRHVGAHLAALHEAVRAMGRTNVDVCLGFVAGTPMLDAVVCGVTGLAELEETAAAFAGGPAAKLDAARFAIDDPAVVDPRRW